MCGVVHRGEVPPTGGKLDGIGCCASGTRRVVEVVRGAQEGTSAEKTGRRSAR
jgi:hypothetical protein